jgi:spore coat polysaccharide biosynthesis protein SpsF
LVAEPAEIIGSVSKSNGSVILEKQTVTIIQARMSSSRLPGKVLQDIGGRPMLAWVVERARLARREGEVLVATTTDGADDPIQTWCQSARVPCFRGSAYDVLDRFYQAASAFHAGRIVRLTADCPLIDPQVIDDVVEAMIADGADFAANRLPPPWHRTFPIGLDVEVCTFSALERAWKEAREPHEREHVMPYLYSLPGRFRVRILDTVPDFGDLRWTVDTPEDLEMVRRLVSQLAPKTDFSWQEVLQIIEQYPELREINRGVVHKIWNDVDRRYPDGR